MATTCKLIIGYVDNFGYWNVTEEYYRHYDGYSEAVLPLLKEFTTADNGVDIDGMNAIAEYESHKFERIEDGFNFGNTNYMYFIDESNRGKIRCSILKEDNDFFNKYLVSNYLVEKELIL